MSNSNSPMGRIFDEKTMTYAFADGSGRQTFEYRLAIGLFNDKWKMLGAEGRRDWVAEYKEFEKLQNHGK